MKAAIGVNCFILITVVILGMSPNLSFADAMNENNHYPESTIASEHSDYKTVMTRWLKMFHSDKDWPEIRTYYEEHLQEIIHAHYAKLDQWFIDALARAERNSLEPKELAVAVGEACNLFYYYELNAVMGYIPELLKAGEFSIAEALLDTTVQLFNGTLAPHLRNLDDNYQTNMMQQIDTVLIPVLRESLKNKHAAQFQLYYEMFNLALLKNFHVMIFHHLNRAEVDKEAFNAAKLAYLPIYQRAKDNHPKQAEEIYKYFSNMQVTPESAEKLKQELIYLVTQQIQTAFDNVLLKLTMKEGQWSLKYAAEALFYIDALELPAAQLLKAEEYAAIKKHSDAYYNLIHGMVREGHLAKLKKASEHAFQIIKILSKNKGIYIPVGKKYYRIDGEKKEFEQDVSFLDIDTDQAWVSLRIIGEALGMKITYQPDNQSILIEIDDKKFKIDKSQSLKIINGHTYMMQKDFVKLTDHRLIWFKEEMVIL